MHHPSRWRYFVLGLTYPSICAENKTKFGLLKHTFINKYVHKHVLEYMFPELTYPTIAYGD
jgi:hypothetical protein